MMVNHDGFNYECTIPLRANNE